YIERVAMVSSGGGNASTFNDEEIIQWVNTIQQWNSKFFTLSHVPSKYRLLLSKFLRRVIIARMAECPELATLYHSKLKQEYEIDETLRDPEILRQSEQQLNAILDEAERRLNDKKTTYLFGEEFTLADVAFVPVLSRLAVLDLEEKYITARPNVAVYWSVVQRRPTYKRVIGKYFRSWRKHVTLLKTWFFVQLRSLLKQY
ncbi:hypothetical protein M569_07387, partial [Genlisea aurea]